MGWQKLILEELKKNYFIINLNLNLEYTGKKLKTSYSRHSVQGASP
jgi:hypothetical protein